jgi:DNA (cytosine-5)-methyltransferase 1
MQVDIAPRRSDRQKERGKTGTANDKPRLIEVFAGVGGLSLGAVRAGFDLALAVDSDRHAMAAHRLNFPECNHLERDVFTLGKTELFSSAGVEDGHLAGLIGGAPCQGFSTMGKRSVLDPRNNLFVRFFQLVSECSPRFFVAENVLGILDGLYDETRERAFDFVRKDYQLLEPIRLKASDFGAATSRERVFFIGYKPDVENPPDKEDFAALKSKSVTTVSRALRGLPTMVRSDWQTEEQGWRQIDRKLTGIFGGRISGVIPDKVGNQVSIDLYRNFNLVSGCLGTKHKSSVRARFARLQPGEKDDVSKATRLKLDGLCPTLRAGTGADRGSYQAVRPIHPRSPRVITPREAARLQGFPDWFQFAPSKWHSFRQIGNSVSPFVAETVLSVMYSRLFVSPA